MRSVSGLAESDYVAINREGWTQANAQYTSKQAEGAWAQKEITWGKWSIPERELDVLPDVQGKDVVELGCGTAYWAPGSSARARRGSSESMSLPRSLRPHGS